MLGEIWKWDSNAVSAVSTAGAALIALGVWIHSICAANRRKTRLIAINQHLMIEELARVSAAAVGVWRLCKNPDPDRGVAHQKEYLQDLLQTEVAKAMLLLAGDFPKKLGVEVAKFVSLAGMVRGILNGLSHALANHGLISFPPGHQLNEASAKYAADLVEQANALASALEESSNVVKGSIRSKIVQLPKSPNDED